VASYKVIIYRKSKGAYNWYKNYVNLHVSIPVNPGKRNLLCLQVNYFLSIMVIYSSAITGIIAIKYALL